MWTTSAKSKENTNILPPQEHQHHKFATEQAGLLFQASYKFGVTAPWNRDLRSVRRETAALRDFGSAYDGFGSFASEEVEAA
jgi:hypothetical protein